MTTKMEAHVRAFRGAVDVAIKIDRVTLLAGLNGAGKSSVLQAVAAAATNNPVPFFNSTKPDSALIKQKDAHQLVNDGKEIGGIRLLADDGAIQVTWPSLDRETEGSAPEISRVAAGILTPLEMTGALRAAFFSSLLQTKPTNEELVEKLTGKDVGLKPKSGDGEDEQNDQPIIDEIIEKVEIGSYDAAVQWMTENRAKLKGRWEATTDERYGANKSEWKPKGWTDELAEADPDALEEQLASARQARDDLRARAAVDGDRAAELEEHAKREQSTHALYQDAHKAAVRSSTAKQEAHDALQAASEYPRLVPCSHCGGMNEVVIRADQSIDVKQSDITKAEADDLVQIYVKAKAAYDAACTELTGKQQAEATAKAQYDKYLGAGKRRATAQASGGTAGAEEIKLAEEAAANLELNVERVKAKARASALHQRIALADKIVAVLEPTGLRQSKLTAAIAGFNGLLASICEGAGFVKIALTDGLDVTYAGRPHFLVSKSEEWRCRVAIQLATAIKEEAPLVIIDGADIIDGPAREQFFQALIELSDPAGANLKVLVAMTLPRPELMPALGKHKVGNAYWLSQGRIETSV